MNQDQQSIFYNPFSSLLKECINKQSFYANKQSLRFGDLVETDIVEDEEKHIVGIENEPYMVTDSVNQNYLSEKSSFIPSHLEPKKSLEDEGKDEHAKHQATKKEEDRQMVDDLVRKSNRTIISISSLFPWNFFRNTIIVEESRVIFIFRQFMSSQSHGVNIKDISNVFIESSLFLATLQVVSRTYIQNDIKINNLNKKKANKVRRIIEGLRTFADNNIDTSNYEIADLINKLEELHVTRGVV